MVSLTGSVTPRYVRRWTYKVPCHFVPAWENVALYDVVPRAPEGVLVSAVFALIGLHRDRLAVSGVADLSLIGA